MKTPDKSEEKGITIQLLDEKKKQEFIHYLQTIPFYFSEDILLDEADIRNFAYTELNDYIIALHDKQIIGHITIQYLKYKYGYHQEHCIEIHINVMKEYQRTGVATLLMKFLFDYVGTKKEIKKIKTKMLENNVVVLHLFESFGFAREATLLKEWKVIAKEREEYINGIYLGKLLCQGDGIYANESRNTSN